MSKTWKLQIMDNQKMIKLNHTDENLDEKDYKVSIFWYNASITKFKNNQKYQFLKMKFIQ